MGGAHEAYVDLLGLISHEYFHAWSVKRLKPAEFEQLDYARENYTQLLWFFEGFTSYYDDLLLRRAGLIDVPRYLGLVSKTLNGVAATPGRLVQSVAQASYDAAMAQLSAARALVSSSSRSRAPGIPSATSAACAAILYATHPCFTSSLFGSPRCSFGVT